MANSVTESKTVLLVDDEQRLLKYTKLILENAGITEVLTLDDPREVSPLLEKHSVAVVVLDLHMPHITGLELLPRLVSEHPQIPVIMMTSNDELETAVACMKNGAFDYLLKPVESGRLISCVRKALDMLDLNRQLSSLKEHLLSDTLDHPEAFSAIITGNKKMRAVFQYLEVVARTRQPVMINGETGVGKELIARAIHDLSGCPGRFVALNVAGLDDNMFSDTLFGHKKGAFTGADQAREGMIASASQGTLFLDEIGDLNEMSQVKLLRLLQEREYYPVGSDSIKKSDARIVLATNQDLQKRIVEGKFRKDLYYRLCAHQVQIPALRERLDDLPLLLDHFLAKAATTLKKKKPTPPPELAVLLSTYDFPGNLRELEGLVFDAVTRHGGGVLSTESFREAIGFDRQPQPGVPSPPIASALDGPMSAIFGHFPTLQEVEDYLVKEALRHSKNNQRLAATLLGIGRQTLNRRLKQP